MIPRRIVYVVKSFPKFSETFVASELVELQRRGIEVRILAAFEPEFALCHRFIIEAGLDHVTTYGVANFDRIVDEFEPDLIHAHFATIATTEAWRLADKFSLPFTFTAHGYDIYRDPPADFAERARASAALITVSMANAQHISRNFGVPLEKIHIITSGVDTSLFRPPYDGDTRASSSDSIAATTAVIACVARYEPPKNLTMLLEACAILRARGLDFRCVMIGEGQSRKEIERARAELRLDEVVELKGAADRAQVVELLQRASIAVLTSSREGMPVCLMEAGACGLPVVATSVGGIPELVEHEVTGLLAPPNDSASFAASIERLLLDGSLRRRMGAAARRRIEAEFSLARQVDRMLTLWDNAQTIRI